MFPAAYSPTSWIDVVLGCLAVIPRGWQGLGVEELDIAALDEVPK